MRSDARPLTAPHTCSRPAPTPHDLEPDQPAFTLWPGYCEPGGGALTARRERCRPRAMRAAGRSFGMGRFTTMVLYAYGGRACPGTGSRFAGHRARPTAV